MGGTPKRLGQSDGQLPDGAVPVEGASRGGLRNRQIFMKKPVWKMAIEQDERLSVQGGNRQPSV